MRFVTPVCSCPAEKNPAVQVLFSAFSPKNPPLRRLFIEAQALRLKLPKGSGPGLNADGGFMATLRSHIDQNDQRTPIAAASIMTDDKQHEVRCGMCARELYVDEDAYHLYSEALISGLDNPFRCEVCTEEYDDLAYEG